MRLISNRTENYGNTPVEWWLTAFYTGKNIEKLDPDGVLYRFHLSHNDLDGLACHVVSTVYDCALNSVEIPLVDLTDALQYKNWDEVHVAHHRMPILHSICKAGAKNIKEALHLIFEACCRSVFYKPVGPKDQIILLITDLGGITDSMFDEFYEEFGDRFQVIVIDHHLATTSDRGKCDPNQIFWYVTGYQEGSLQSATKNLFTATYGSYNAVHASSTTSGRVSKKQETFVKQLTEYVEAVSKYDTGRWGEWLDRKTPDDVDLSVQHQLFFNRMAWDSCADVFHRIIISNYVQDMIYLLSTEDYVHTNRAYWEIVRGNLNKLHKEFCDMRQLTLAYNPHLTLTLKIDPIDGVYNPTTRHTIRLGDITTNVQPVNNRLHPLVTFGIIELSKDQSQTKEWKYFSLCSRELMKKYKLDLFILVDEPNGTVSLRSMDNHGFEINCANIAWRNGGGGHKRAAGYPIPKVEVPEDDDTDTEEYDAEDAEDLEDDTEEAEDDETEEADADESSEGSGEELILNAYPPIGTNVHWAGHNWIVSHVTSTEVYLTLNGIDGKSTWDNLQNACTTFANSLTEAQKACLKSVTAGNTSGKVFVATKDQMNGDFSYFDSNSRCSVRDVYWTSTEKTSRNAWGVDSDGCLGKYSYDKSNSIGFRPSIAIWAKELCNNHDTSDESDDSEGENSDEEPIPVMDLNKAIRWAGINWRPLQQDDDLLYLTPYEPTDDLKLCTFSELEDVAAEWGAKHLSDSDQSALVPIQINGKSYNVAPITLEHILNIPDARNAKFAQISMPYGNVPYWTGSSAYNGGDTDIWCMNEKGQNVPVNKDAFLAFRPMICLHITNALVGNLDDEKPIALTPNISNAYPSAGKHVYWAGNDWIITHVDLKMVYMTLADVVPDWKVAWDDLQDTCYEWAKKTFSTEELKKLVPITCGNTHGKVWVASKRLMETGLAYFAESEEHRAASCRYWTSTEYSNVSAWNVDANGDIFELNGIKTCQHGFRPSICMLRSNFGPEDRTVGHYENTEIVNGCRTLIATGMQVMWANQRWIVSNIQPEIIMLTLAHSIPDLMDWEDLQDACNAWGNENLGDQKSKLAYLLVGGICGKVFVATKSDMDGGFDYFTDDDKRYLGECYWTSTRDANGTTYYVDETGKIQCVSGQAMCLDTAPKFTFRPTVAIWTKEFCNDNGVKVVSE